ncbi:MAG TPA: PAS domain S-box protein [Bryobacteraceae bacterium]|nr:PAS domain S-box protein [Bryobacteraceae bacterium]
MGTASAVKVAASSEAPERWELEARLRESEERFRNMFEEAPVACHEIDREGFVLRVNQAECVLFGFEPSEMIGRRIQDFMPPEARERSAERMQKMLSGEIVPIVFEGNYTRRDGTVLVLEVYRKLMRDATGHPVGIRSFTLDVTEQRRAEEALRKRTESLARSNAELEQFASIASHDLQEPLRKIRAFADRLRTKSADTLTAEGADYLARMQNAAARMQTLIDDLLSLSRVTTKGQPFVAVDLAEVVQTVLSDLESRLTQTGGRVEVGPLPIIVADRGQIAQLLQNLIGNGLKFHKPGEAPVVKIHGEVQKGTVAAPGMCQIVVEDNGVGFEQKYADRIFRIFERLNGRSEYEGTGIGLAICRKVVERHGGTVTACSAPGSGATFTITLPSRPAAQETKS